jgi:hypothetical protein
MYDDDSKNEILQSVATIKEHSRNMEKKIDTILENNIDMAKRIATLELWKEGIMGKLAIVTIVIGAGWTFIIKKYF